MATAIVLEQFMQRARDHHRERGEIPTAEWDDMVRAAEIAFSAGRTDSNTNEPAAAGRFFDRDQTAALDLARAMALSGAQERANPFERAELRQAFESERAYARSPDDRFERAPEHDRRFARGDDFAGDAWRDRDSGELRYMVVGRNPNNIERAQAGQRYAGRVIEVTPQHVFQQVGDRTIEHDRQALTGRAMANADELRGRSVEIHYPHGHAGLVRETGQQAELSDRRRDMSKDYGRER